MVDGAIRVLSLANQLAFATKRVRLNFEAGEDGTMGYLNRMGFFDHLDQRVEVLPRRPMFSGAMIHRGGNSMLVEIARISSTQRDEGLPTRLSQAITKACAGRPDIDELSGATWMIFAELIDNIFSHSAT